MAKPSFADIPGFKKLDAALRDAISAHGVVLHAIKTSRSGRRSPTEIATLVEVEKEVQSALEKAKLARHVLWKGVA